MIKKLLNWLKQKQSVCEILTFMDFIDEIFECGEFRNITAVLYDEICVGIYIKTL